MSALEGIADELGEAEHVADVPTRDIRHSRMTTVIAHRVPVEEPSTASVADIWRRAVQSRQ